MCVDMLVFLFVWARGKGGGEDDNLCFYIPSSVKISFLQHTCIIFVIENHQKKGKEKRKGDSKTNQ